MKKITLLAVFFLAITAITSCGSEDSIGESQIDTSTPELSALDIWLRENLVTPYNIEVRYLWDINATDVDRFLHPPLESNVQPMAEALLKTWIEPYNTVGGENFVAKIAPRLFTFVGSFNFNPNSPTITLGIAEGGVKISIFNIDFLDFSSVNSIRQPLKTVHHEYAHILNQNIAVDPSYGQITPENYTAQWFNVSLADARELGFITSYASSNENDDFVEMVSEMLTNTKAEFDAFIDGVTSEEAKAKLRQKEAMVVDYYLTNFGIDIYELQELTNAAIEKFVE